VRAAKGLLQTVPGEVLGPGAMLLTSFSVLGPLCILSGALFTAGSKVYQTAATTSAGEATGSVYLWEAVGSSGGGVVAGLMLIRYLSSLDIAWLLAVLNLMAACGLAITSRPLRRAVIGGLVGIAAVLAFSGWPQRLEAISRRTSGAACTWSRRATRFTAAWPSSARKEAERLRKRRGSVQRARSASGRGSRPLRAAGASVTAQSPAHRWRAQREHRPGSAAPTLQRVDYVELDPPFWSSRESIFRTIGSPCAPTLACTCM